MTTSPVLVWTHWQDYAADLVVIALGRHGVPVFRIDTDDLPGLAFTAHLGPRGRWDGRLTTDLRTVDLGQVRSVYLGRPSAYLVPGMSPGVHDWSAGQVRMGLDATLETLPCRWLNHPAKNRRAEHKPLQLHAESEEGRIDWRADHKHVTYRPCPIPGDVSERIRAFRDRLGLIYGAFDFSIDRDATWWFLEFTDWAVQQS